VLIPIVFSICGLALLPLAANLLLRGSVNLAQALGVPRLVIGLSVVALGTSMPEIVTSFRAVLAGEPGIVLGNAIGSNIANLGLVLGLAGLAGLIPVGRMLARIDGLLMVLTALLASILLWDGKLSRLDGLVLLAALGALSWMLLRQNREPTVQLGERVAQKAGGLVAHNVLLVIAGACGLALGAHLLVGGASRLAELWGLSGTFIGATLVALGTGAPEIATTYSALRQKHYHLLLGNLVGSCQLNLVVVLGATSAVLPLQADGAMLSLHLPAMLLVSLAAWLILLTDRAVTRLEGVLLLAMYLAYIGLAYFLS
jgi:cation:H+ antiporter